MGSDPRDNCHRQRVGERVVHTVPSSWNERDERDMPGDPRELASGGRLQNRGAKSFRGSGKTWVPIIKMRYEEWCWFYKAVVRLALDVIWLRY